MHIRSASARCVTLALGVSVVAGAALTGCQAKHQVRRRPTPELYTLHARTDDVNNSLVVTRDENLRMLSQDAGRFFLLDRPSRLTRESVPH